MTNKESIVISDFAVEEGFSACEEHGADCVVVFSGEFCPICVESKDE